MDTRPPLDRELILPILIGGLSIVGIVVVLLIGRSLNAPAQVATTPSDTPFQYIYLGTEPAVGTPFEVTSNPVSPTSPPLPSTPTTEAAVSPPIVLGTPNATDAGGPPGVVVPTNPPSSGTSTADSIYDDTDPRLVYSGDWVGQTGLPQGPDGTPYQGTLHVSTTRGNTITFTFTGTEIHFFYEAGPSLGSVAVTIDGLGSPPFSQSQGNRWSSGPLSPGTHSIVIEHFDGGSVNIDSLMISGATPTTPPGTATSTATPTPTQ